MTLRSISRASVLPDLLFATIKELLARRHQRRKQPASKPYSGLQATSPWNGDVRGFSRGVSTFGGVVEDITAESNFIAGISRKDALVRSNNSSRNQGAGITCADCVVTENVANSNHGNGFIMVFGEYSEAMVKVTPAGRTSRALPTSCVATGFVKYREHRR